MNRYWFFIGTIFFVCIGIFFSGLMHEWIIIRFPSNRLSPVAITHDAPEEKAIEIYMWKGERWSAECVNVCTSHDNQSYLTAIVSLWLAAMQEEQIISYNVFLQSVLCSVHGDIAYISFSDTFIQHNKPTIENLLCIEGLLRTIRKNSDTTIHSCVFLINHSPICDSHLDFSQPWPVGGFLDIF